MKRYWCAFIHFLLGVSFWFGATARSPPVKREWCDVGKVYVGVMSAAMYRDKRDAIRATWKVDAEAQGATVEFFVGVSSDNDMNLSIIKEQKETGDLVQSGVSEGYFSITNKTVAIIHAAASLLPDYTHVIKTDDDTFVRYSKVIRFLRYEGFAFTRKPTLPCARFD